MSIHSRFLTLISGSGNQSKFWDYPKPFLKKQRSFCTHIGNPKRCKKTTLPKKFSRIFYVPIFHIPFENKVLLHVVRCFHD